MNDTIITSKLMGGVGNQLFQIATAYAYARKYNANLLFQLMQFDGCRQGSHPSKYYGSLYKKLQFVDQLPVQYQISEDGFTYSPIDNKVKAVLSMQKDPIISLYGYWQSDLYFQEYAKEIKELFTPSEGIVSYLEKNTSIFSRYPKLKESHDSCFIGIRRGDYLKYADVHNPCGMTYYKKAMETLKKERYYIASDDIEWCKANFKGDQYTFFEIQDDLEQLLVSTLFKNYIISNSSFHWWASFLSVYENPTIIAPDKWLFGADATPDKYYSVYRKDMIVIERPIEIT